jgi:hypothetical protein
LKQLPSPRFFPWRRRRVNVDVPEDILDHLGLFNHRDEL